MGLTVAQLEAIETTERVASCFSVVGTIFIFITFISSSKFRRPINRLVFYASWGNTICNIATLMSRSPIGYGADSHLCQFQGFLIQMFVPADAFWNLAMAFNVYLTLFRKFNASQLKSLEWRYLALCYGIPFIIAFTLLFPSPPSRGKIYGDAVLWCWIDEKWDFLRVALCYGPAWVCILASMTIYVMAGREIFSKRYQLRAFRYQGPLGPNAGGAAQDRSGAGKGAPGPSDLSSDDSSTAVGDDPASYKTTNVEITSTIVPLENIATVLLPGMDVMGNQHPRGAPGAGIRTQSSMSGKVYEQYTVDIGAQPMGSNNPRFGGIPWGGSARSGPGVGGSEEQARARRNRAAVEANRAAWGYTKVALLFFVSLLVTWVPSSVNRVYALTHPTVTSLPLAYAAGIVLSLMGFWNSVIYIVTSRAACRELFRTALSYIQKPSRITNARLGSLSEPKNNNPMGVNGGGRVGSPLSGHRRASVMGGPKVSWGDDFERLTDEDVIEGETKGRGGVGVEEV